MGIYDSMTTEEKLRIVQELVPGKQISLAHIIAAPDRLLIDKLSFQKESDKSKASIGILTMSPAEAVIIGADLAVKASGVTLQNVDYTSGTLVFTGTVSEVESAMNAIVEYSNRTLSFSVCDITRT
jgi:ethanolamine utilization protein EutS|nr:BMC domain-containing protein [uncultured Lachnoclostridium sp.]